MTKFFNKVIITFFIQSTSRFIQWTEVIDFFYPLSVMLNPMEWLENTISFYGFFFPL